MTGAANLVVLNRVHQATLVRAHRGEPTNFALGGLGDDNLGTIENLTTANGNVRQLDDRGGKFSKGNRRTYPPLCLPAPNPIMFKGASLVSSSQGLARRGHHQPHGFVTPEIA